MLIPLACQLGRQKTSINSLVVALQYRVGRQVTLANQRRSKRRLFTSSDHHQLVVRRIRGAFVDPIMQRPVGQAHCPNWAAEIHCYGVWSGIVSTPLHWYSTPRLRINSRIVSAFEGDYTMSDWGSATSPDPRSCVRDVACARFVRTST